MLKTGRGAPAGLLIYHDTRIPEQYRGLLYYPDVFRKLIRAYKVAPDGSTFKITNEFEFLKTEDPLFRPCQMITGPDGAIYICDWRTNSGGAGKLSGDGIHGRIYRVTWVGDSETPAIPRREMDSWLKIQQLPDDKLVEALGRPALTDRVEARKELVRRGPKARDLVLRKLISGKLDGDARIPALGVLFAGWNADVEDLCRLLLNDSSPDVRRVAVEGLGLHAKPKDYRLIEAIMKALGDQEPSVRRAGAVALGRIGGESAPSALVNYLQVDRQGDAFLKDAYLRALERLGKPGIDALLSLASSGDKEREIAIECFVGMRSKAAADALPELLLRPDISTAQREALVRSYTNYQFDPPISLDPLVAFLARRPNESLDVVRAAVEVFAVSGEANAKKANDLVLRLITHPDDEVRYVAIKAVEDLRLSAASPQLVTILGNSTRRESERAAAVNALRVLGDKKAVAPLQAVLTGPHPATLKSVALQALAALDIAAARSAAEKLLDQPDTTLLNDAVSVLSTTKAGAKLIGERFVAKKLPRDFFPQVTEALKKFAEDPTISKLQTEALRGALLVSLEPGQIEKVRKLVADKGDPKRGRDLYLNTKLLACATCHRMEGVGGSVGPDLTRIWDTMTLDKLLESIVDPSKEIKEGFQTYRLATADGQIFTGLKIKEDTKEVVIREANGRDSRIDKDNIDSLTPSKLSLMPDNVVAQITYEQFIDLLAFLKSKKEQESLRGMVAEIAVTGPFPPDLKSGKAEVTATAKWKTLYAEPSGKLDLASFIVPDSAVYARAFVFAPKKQKVSLTVKSENPLRVWVNELSAFDRQSSGTGVEEIFPAELKQGWNVVLVKIPNAGKPPALSIRLTGEGLRTAVNPDNTALPGTTAGGG
jgi:quinoprotein glucose dehydrogenase